MNSVQQRFLLFCLFVGIIILGGAFLVVSSISKQPTTTGNVATKSTNINAAEKGVSMADRLGVDDNASIAFLYGSDMQGSLDVCG